MPSHDSRRAPACDRTPPRRLRSASRLRGRVRTGTILSRPRARSASPDRDSRSPLRTRSADSARALSRTRGPEEDLRVLRVPQGVPLAAKRVEIVGRDDPEALERRVGVLGLAEGEEGSAFVFQGPRMVRLDREDRVACHDEIGPALGPQQEVPLRLESVVGSRLDGQETIEGRQRFFAAVQLDARMGFRVQRAGMPGVEGDDIRSLLYDLVPSGEGPERLEASDAGSQRLRGETHRAIVGADRADAPAYLAH